MIRPQRNVIESYVTKDIAPRRVNEDKGKCVVLHRNILLHFSRRIGALILLIFFEHTRRRTIDQPASKRGLTN
ncbi:hypothetical protein [Burkholderia sp. 22PA0106]|uniref:hypothetical protein n=1 Tax=Burkholderia sp. 22PA0106 TaxID=3237371 RepID=UPI0039C2B4B9